MDLTLDVFNQDAFNAISLTDSINKIPFIPGRCGQVVGFIESGITTTSIMIEEKNGVLQIINPSPRGGVGQTSMEPNRAARSLIVPHYEVPDQILADSVQNVRAWGTTSMLETLQDRVNQRLQEHVNYKLDPTLEYQRLGAVKGLILNGDGSTLYNLFTEFNVSEPSEIHFDLDNATPASGALRRACAGVARTIANNLGGTGYTGLRAFCGDTFFDDLVANVEVVASYKNTDMASVLRTGYVDPNVFPSGNAIYGTFEFGGIVWENYRGLIGSTPMVDPNLCHIFPVGAPGLWRTIYAPADYEETVNTVGLPRYAKQYPMLNGKGRHLESQMNALSYCTRPATLVTGTRGS
jgi:hypothetical protein